MEAASSNVGALIENVIFHGHTGTYSTGLDSSSAFQERNQKVPNSIFSNCTYGVRASTTESDLTVKNCAFYNNTTDIDPSIILDVINQISLVNDPHAISSGFNWTLTPEAASALRARIPNFLAAEWRFDKKGVPPVELEVTLSYCFDTTAASALKSDFQRRSLKRRELLALGSMIYSYSQHLAQSEKFVSSAICRITMIEKLFSGLEQIETMPLSELGCWERLVPIIQNIGLYSDPYKPYGKDEIYVNPDNDGLWQIPQQMAKALTYLSKFEIRKMVEIGTFRGWTSAVMTTYLRRFNPTLSTLTIDPDFHCPDFELIQSRLPITYVHTTSQALSHGSFDLAFIDGDHSYSAVMADYKHVGIHSPICLLHDINDIICARSDHEGSVPKAWKDIKASENGSSFIEFLDHSEGRECMGIGLRVLPSAIRRA